LDEYPMPDPVLTLEDLKAQGYREDDLLPVSQERAAELMEQDFTVYAVSHDGPELVLDRDEIGGYPVGFVFAIPREEWEDSPAFHHAIAERMDRQKKREAAFLNHTGDCFAIYQLRDGDETHSLRFMPLPEQGVDKKFYELAYTAPLPDGATLDTLWQKFNVDHPPDYHRPSMSVSDIVALKQGGVVSCHYVDRFGFTPLPGFFEKDNPLKNAEMLLEDDCNMLDGVINNGPKEGPTVAELEAQVKAGQQISLMDLAGAVHREQRKKPKKSILGQLKSQPRQERKKSAPKKSAEREL